MTKIKWFLPSEIVVHNTSNDVWVIINEKVFDLTKLFAKYKEDPKINPILAFAGKDISCWFDADDEFKTFINPVTNKRVVYLPYGPVLHQEEYERKKELMLKNFVPWWKDRKYIIGKVTKNPRPIKILNTMTEILINLSVCEEETFNDIAERYKVFHSDCLSYSWFYLDRSIAMSKTLIGNGIPDEREKYLELGLPHDLYVPVIVLFYNDECILDCERVPLPIVDELTYIQKT